MSALTRQLIIRHICSLGKVVMLTGTRRFRYNTAQHSTARCRASAHLESGEYDLRQHCVCNDYPGVGHPVNVLTQAVQSISQNAPLDPSGAGQADKENTERWQGWPMQAVKYAEN